MYTKSEDYCLDMLSSLPDELLVHMLSFLPIRFAVSTCILSKRWRHLFSLMNCLSFDDSDSRHFNGSEINGEIDAFYEEATLKERFVESVHNVLGYQISPIKILRLVLQGSYDAYDLDTWVNTTMHKGVQEIDYQVVQQRCELPRVLFICETLVRLKIMCNPVYQVSIPISSQLPRLKILHLENVVFFYEDTVERFFSGCNLLEELTLKSCQCVTECHAVFSTRLLKVLNIEGCSFWIGLFEIDAPNLEYLTYIYNIGVKIAPSWKHSSSLVRADLYFDYTVEDDYNHSFLQHDRGLLKGAPCKATKLLFYSESFELLLTPAEHEEMPDFPNLSVLRLDNCPYYAWNYVTSLLDKSPQLETINFESGLHRCRHDPKSPPIEALIPFSCEAKLIEVWSFCGHECSLILLGHLLRNARALKKLILHKNCGIDMEEELRVRKALLMLPSASNDFYIELK